KALFPGLRVSYLVAPPALVDAFSAACIVTGQQPPLLEQAVLADFIEQGHFGRHIRRMRTLYAERQARLVETAKRKLNGLLTIGPADAGMHVVAWLPRGWIDSAVARRCEIRGVTARPLSSFRL